MAVFVVSWFSEYLILQQREQPECSAHACCGVEYERAWFFHAYGIGKIDFKAAEASAAVLCDEATT